MVVDDVPGARREAPARAVRTPGRAPRMGRGMRFGREDCRRLYEKQAQIAWHGGILSRKDRMLLDQLGVELGLSIDETMRIEEKVLRTNT